MNKALVKWLLIPCLVLACETSAQCQSTFEAPVEALHRPAFLQSSPPLFGEGDLNAHDALLGLKYLNGTTPSFNTVQRNSSTRFSNGSEPPQSGFETGPRNSNGLSSPGTILPSGNPAATDLQVGSGWLGNWLDVNQDGFRLGGLNVSNVNAQVSGGVNPGSWTTGSLTILDMSLDLEERMDWNGGRAGIELLFYSGGDIDGDAGTVMGYNSIDGDSPRTRLEIYTLWYRQYLFDKQVTVHIGKLVPTYDFNNVTRSIPFADKSYDIPAVTSTILTPLYVSPTQLGIMPGYYNSATGTVASFTPNDNIYAQYGIYDGNLAAGRQTGLEGPHFNGNYLQIAEGGANWTIGQQVKPGAFGAGYWKQSGLLSTPSGNVRGAEGVYCFASQRLFFEDPGQSNNGLTSWIQLAATNSDFISTHRYLGVGLTYFGLIPSRESDSAGFAFAYGKMNTDPAANLGPRESIYSWYYQYQANKNCYLQPNLTYITTPASSPGVSDALALTFQAIVVF